jgi:hypothetical protein
MFATEEVNPLKDGYEPTKLTKKGISSIHLFLIKSPSVHSNIGTGNIQRETDLS